MAVLKLNLPDGELPVTGKQITFIAPCSSGEFSRIVVCDFPFDLVDSLGELVTANSFAEGSMISVTLNCETSKAYIQNAGSTAFLERELANKSKNGNLLDGAYEDSVYQKVSGAIFDMQNLDFVNSNLRLGNTGESYSDFIDYVPEEVATLEKDGWEYNREGTSPEVDKHSGTGIDSRSGLKVAFSGNYAFSVKVNLSTESTCLLWISASKTGTSADPVCDVYLNEDKIGVINTSTLKYSGYHIIFAYGDTIKFKEGVNTITLVCTNHTGGEDKYLDVDFMEIRSKANLLEGLNASAFGVYNQNRGFTSMVTNYNNIVDAHYSFAANYSNYIDENAVVGFVGGYHNNLLFPYQTAFGLYNNPEEGALFMVGNGSIYQRSNALAVYRDGTIKVCNKVFDFNKVEFMTSYVENQKAVIDSLASEATVPHNLGIDVFGNLQTYAVDGKLTEVPYLFTLNGHPDMTYNDFKYYTEYPDSVSSSSRKWCALGTTASLSNSSGLFSAINAMGVVYTMAKEDEFVALKLKVEKKGRYSLTGNVLHYKSGGVFKVYVLPMTEELAYELDPNNTDTYGTVTSAGNTSLPNQKKRTDYKSFKSLSIAEETPIGTVDTYDSNASTYLERKWGAIDLEVGEYLVVFQATTSRWKKYALGFKDITLKLFEESHHSEEKNNPHEVTKEQVGLGSVPNVATNDQTPTYTQESSLTNLTSGEKLSVAFGKIKKAIADFISHKNSKSNPHGVSASQIGAAPMYDSGTDDLVAGESTLAHNKLYFVYEAGEQ